MSDVVLGKKNIESVGVIRLNYSVIDVIVEVAVCNGNWSMNDGIRKVAIR